jgi:hypothetical protein
VFPQGCQFCTLADIPTETLIIFNFKTGEFTHTVMDRSMKHPWSLKHSMRSLSIPKLSLHKYLRVLATYIHTKINQNIREIWAQLSREGEHDKGQIYDQHQP